MTSTFRAIVDLVEETFTSQLGPDHGIQFLVGENSRHSRERLNTIIWVSTSGPIEPYPTGGAPLLYVEDGQNYAGDPFLQRVFDVEVDCYGATDEAAEALMRNVLRALESRLSTRGFAAQGWEDVSGQLGKQVKGSLLRLSCQIRSPLLSEWEVPMPTVQMETSGSLNQSPGCETAGFEPPNED